MGHRRTGVRTTLFKDADLDSKTIKQVPDPQTGKGLGTYPPGGARSKKAEESQMVDETKTEATKKKKKAKGLQLKPRAGLDIGTAFLMSARRHVDSDDFSFKKIRDAFVEVPSDKMPVAALERQKVSFVVMDGKPYVLGDHALRLSAILLREPRRPLQNGIISPKEQDAFPILFEMIKSILGDPLVEKERVFYSVPADSRVSEFNSTYHRNVFDKILRELGYNPEAMTEALAAAYAAPSHDKDFLVTISMGAGMCNVAVTYLLMPIVEFSIPFGGDWLDTNVSSSLGVPSPICVQKKEGDDFTLGGTTNIEEAYKWHYASLLDTLFEHIIAALQDARCADTVPVPVHLQFVGGTTKPSGFNDLLNRSVHSRSWPVAIDGVAVFRDPDKLVSKGLLIALETQS